MKKIFENSKKIVDKKGKPRYYNGAGRKSPSEIGKWSDRQKGKKAMYWEYVRPLLDELKKLKEICKKGEQDAATISRIAEIELLLNNVYWTELE